MHIEYETIKRELSIEKILGEYGMATGLKQRGKKLIGPCPVHLGDNPTAFNVDIEKNLWNCFTHCRGGSVIDLIMQIEKISVYEAGRIGYNLLGKDNGKGGLKKQELKPLNFKLHLEYNHPYLRQRNIDPKTAKYFDIGYCNTGIMNGRIAIPIHDRNNKLVAYCGRAVDDVSPKYLFPGRFPKNRVLYNLNRINSDKNKKIAIVEGFFDVFALYRAGVDSVALMGCSISSGQKKQLLSLEQRLTLMLDGDDAGRKGMEKAVHMLNAKRPIKAIYLPEQMQPEDLTPAYLKDLI